MSTSIEVLTRDDLLQFRKDLIEEFKKMYAGVSLQEQHAEYLKSGEVKRMLKCSNSTLQFYRQSGKLPAQKVGGTYYYTQDDIHHLMKPSGS
jgi:helix-turn-helix protein